MKRLFNLSVVVSMLVMFSCRPLVKEQNEMSATATSMPQLERLNESIKNSPNEAKLYFQRGKLYKTLQKDSLALKDLYKAVKLDSTQSNYYSAIGDILFEHKDISGSVQWIQKAISLNADDQLAHLKLGKLFLYTEEYPKAFTEINTVLRSDVYNVEAYFLKGMVYKNLKDTNRAISSFQTAVQTDPTYKDAHLQLALIYKAKNNPLALNYFENAFRADSSDMEPLYGQGMFWQDQGKYAEAKKVFKRCILINKDYEKSYYNIGWMLLQEDSVEKALKQFDIAVQVKQNYPEAYYNRGLCYEILENFEAARADYQQALVFNPEFNACKIALQRIK